MGTITINPEELVDKAAEWVIERYQAPQYIKSGLCPKSAMKEAINEAFIEHLPEIDDTFDDLGHKVMQRIHEKLSDQ